MTESDKSLSRFISRLNITDSESKIDDKLIVVEKFEKFMGKHVLDINKKLNINTVISNGHCAYKLLTHGSTELGISLKKSDIDVVLVLPNYISRNQWFNYIVEKLRENSDKIHDIVPIIDTFVPVIKLKYENLQFDMVISCLSGPSVPSRIDFDEVCNNLPSIYDGIDSISIRGLSSICILHKIKSMIADQQQIFVKFIRTIKIWTLKREIDSYIFGFPSAIAWVIMALFVFNETKSQTSKLTAFELVKRFFFTFKVWKWPEPVEVRPKSFESFNCERHLMPIISLVYPFKNTAFTVRPSSLKVIMDEFRRADSIIHNSDDYNKKWEKLFQELDISKEYRHFIHLRLSCSDDSFIRFQGLIASKLRDYASQLESINKIVLARIHSIGRPDNCEYDYQGKRNYSWIIGLKLEENHLFKSTKKRTEIDLTEATLCFFHILNEKCPYNNFQKMLFIEYIKGREILKVIDINGSNSYD